MKPIASLNVARFGLRTRPLSPRSFLASSLIRHSLTARVPSYASPLSTATAQSLSRASDYLLGVYARPDIVLSHGKGSYVWDTEGKKYLDFSAGIAVNALGHADEGYVECMKEQSGKVLHTSNVWYNEWAGKLAELLVNTTKAQGGLGFPSGASSPGGGAKIFFSNSGTEANEGALKIARKVGKDRWAAAVPGRSWDAPECSKTRIVCFGGSFHGRSMGALSVTSNPKYQKPFEPLLPGIDVGTLNDVASLRTLVTEDTCAVIVEPIQGEGGINAANEEWLRALRKRCDETGAVLIFDEIQCGLFRTGRLWAHSGFPVDCHPDMVTMAKPLANGYPIGAVMLRDSLAETMTPGTHGTTFGGSPLACALGHYTLTKLASRETLDEINASSQYLISRLEQLPKSFSNLLQPNIRGRGMILGLGFRNAEHPAEIVGLARERGVLVLTAGKDAVRIVPSLTIGKKEVDEAVGVLKSCLEVLPASA